jgi:hypothetical protein
MLRQKAEGELEMPGTVIVNPADREASTYDLLRVDRRRWRWEERSDQDDRAALPAQRVTCLERLRSAREFKGDVYAVATSMPSATCVTSIGLILNNSARLPR